MPNNYSMPLLSGPQMPGMDQWLLNQRMSMPQQQYAQPQPQQQQPMGMGQTGFNGVGNMLGFNQPPAQPQLPQNQPMNLLPQQQDPDKPFGAMPQQGKQQGMGQALMQFLLA